MKAHYTFLYIGGPFAGVDVLSEYDARAGEVFTVGLSGRKARYYCAGHVGHRRLCLFLEWLKRPNTFGPPKLGKRPSG